MQRCWRKTPTAAEDPDGKNVFWVPKKARRSHLQDNAKQPTIGKLIDDAMSEISVPPFRVLFLSSHSRAMHTAR